MILSHGYVLTFTLTRLPNITVSSCTPGYIATDLTKDFLVKQGKTAKEAGMKTPAEVICIIDKIEVDIIYSLIRSL